MSLALITTFFCSFCAEMCAKIILIEKLHDLAYNGGRVFFFTTTTTIHEWEEFQQLIKMPKKQIRRFLGDNI